MTNKRPCEYCEKIIWTTNMKSHLKKCVYKIDLNVPKKDLLKLIGSSDGKLKKNSPRRQIKYQKLLKFLEQTYYSSDRMFKSYKLDNKDPKDHIKEMGVSESTKLNYLSLWNQYMKFLKGNDMEICRESANSYIATIKNKDTTIKKKCRDLQYLFRYLIDPYMVLHKVTKKTEVTPKYSLKDEELQKYLSEQKKTSREDYLIQLLLATYGLRINNTALLKLKHLTFLKSDKNTILLPDMKSKRARSEPIEEELKSLLRSWVQDNKIDDDNKYIFYPDETFRGDNRKRAALFSRKINSQIQKSKVLVKDPNYMYSSHMFRKTVAYNYYNEQNDKLKEMTRKRIGQEKGSQALNSYIYS